MVSPVTRAVTLAIAPLLAVVAGMAQAQTPVDFARTQPVFEDTPARIVDESRFAKGAPPAPGIPLRPPDLGWVDATLGSMTLEQKVGQMFMASQSVDRLTHVNNYHIGGFIFIGNGQDAADIVSVVNALQAEADIPLWFSLDAEAGIGARVGNATIFPMAMAFGAVEDRSLIEDLGRITARESQALGVQTVLGPVVDVNSEPINPIISTRSYGDVPARIAVSAGRFLQGAAAEGALCTLKHYPGHGATKGDSHNALPGVDIPRAAIEQIHIGPYRHLIADPGVDLVMTAHVWYSDVYPDAPFPATLSPIFNDEILRGDLGFEGVLISDAFGMAGLAIAVPDETERALQAIESGVDVILDTGDIGTMYNGVLAAVQAGRLTVDRIDESARRVLIAKSRAGLPERATVDPVAWQTVLNHPEHRAAVRRVAEAAFTEARNNIGAPVIQPGDDVLLLTLSAQTLIFYRFSPQPLRDALASRVASLDMRHVSLSVSTAERTETILAAAAADKVIIAGYDWTRISSSSQVELINALSTADTPVTYLSFGAPYHYLQIPNVDAFFCGYATVPQMQEVAAEVLVGERAAVGRLPVIVDGLPVTDSTHLRIY